jgi:hypothetical protein
MGDAIFPNSSARASKLFLNRRMYPNFPAETIAALARAFTSAIFTPVGQTLLHTRQPLQKSTELSEEYSSGTRNRPACGPSYFGPGNKSVTADTGQAVVQTLHFIQLSIVCST